MTKFYIITEAQPHYNRDGDVEYISHPIMFPVTMHTDEQYIQGIVEKLNEGGTEIGVLNFYHIPKHYTEESKQELIELYGCGEDEPKYIEEKVFSYKIVEFNTENWKL